MSREDDHGHGRPADAADEAEQARRVSRYYDGNTRWMLRLGAGSAERVLHRPVWVDGVRDRGEALRTAERLIAGALELRALGGNAGATAPPTRLLDLGCGAGSSAIWMAERFAVSVTGVTVSALQARAAADEAGSRGLEERCRFVAGDFLDPPPLAPADAGYAIEAFGHAASPQGFFQAAAWLLVNAGRLVICDDFLEEQSLAGGSAQRRRDRCLARFRRGWHLASLISLEELVEHAAAAGFALESRRDLTPWLALEPRTLRLPRLALGLALANTPWGSSHLGSAALQQALAAGWVRYLLLVLKKR